MPRSITPRFSTPRRWRPTTAAALGVALVAGLAGASTASPPSSASGGTGGAAVPTINWEACGEAFPDFECASVEVPTDYDQPDGATTTIALTKLPATDSESRIGSLFTNPGGPGGSGVEFVQAAGKIAYTPQVREHFDIIGFDPRGVGASDPVTCYENAEEENEVAAAMEPFPYVPAKEKEYVRRTVEFAKACVARSRDRIAHSSTANVARDMDLLRQAVGDEKLTYAGYSYGTFLGATYAKLFPNNIRAMVLDATLEPVRYTGRNGDRRPLGMRIGQGPAASRAFDQFLRLCREAGPKPCSLARLGNPRKVMDRTFRSLKSAPVTIEPPGGAPVEVTYQTLVAVLFSRLYSPGTWSDLSDTLAYVAIRTDSDARRTSGELRLSARDAAADVRRTRGEDYPSAGGAHANMCVDTLNPLRPRGYAAYADREDKAAPHFGRYRAWVGLTCAAIDVKDDDAFTGNWKQQVDEPIMVVGTRYDPATPYEYTRPFTDKFPDGRMLTVDGWGHGGSLFQSKCADRGVARYLVKLKATDGKTCKPDTLPFAAPPAETARKLPLIAPSPLA